MEKDKIICQEWNTPCSLGHAYGHAVFLSVFHLCKFSPIFPCQDTPCSIPNTPCSLEHVLEHAVFLAVFLPCKFLPWFAPGTRRVPLGTRRVPLQLLQIRPFPLPFILKPRILPEIASKHTEQRNTTPTGEKNKYVLNITELNTFCHIKNLIL